MLHIFASPTIVSIQSEARNKHKYPRILVTAVCFNLMLFMAFAVLGYIAFRDDTKPIFIMCLTPMDPFIVIVFICFSLNTFTSYPI